MERDKAFQDKRRVKPKARMPWLEWLASGVGLLLALVVFGLIGWQAVKGAAEPPAIIVEVDNVTSVSGGYRVEVPGTQYGRIGRRTG